MGLFNKLFGSKDNNNSKEQTNSKTKQEPANKASLDDIPWMTHVRRESLSICTNVGFRPASSLPTDLGRQLRPATEIANRLHAIKALVLWFMVPEANLSSDRILGFINENNLMDWITEQEKAILSTPRDDEQGRNAIGWKFENAWPLAWYFGYTETGIMGQMMSGDQMKEILVEHTCSLEKKISDWVKERETITEQALLQKEDTFYCLHNAVRSAQLGSTTVPANFDPMGNGGVIHERRHSLTWMLSKGVQWEETDLST